MSIAVIKAKRYIRFLFTMIILNKAFRILYTIFRFDNIIISLNKKHTQIDQGFDINVIFIKLIKIFELQLHLLKKIDFKDLLMRIINYREIVLKH